MSKYSEISKRIGWDDSYCAIPSVEVAKELHEKVVKEHCEKSFELVFKIHRFAPTSASELEFEAMKEIFEAFSKGTKIFSSY